MHANTKSVCITFICEISFPWDAPHIYHFVYIYIPAPDMPPNSHKVHRSDPAIIEDTAFNHVRYLRGDGRGLARACACEDQLGAWVCFMASS